MLDLIKSGQMTLSNTKMLAACARAYTGDNGVTPAQAAGWFKKATGADSTRDISIRVSDWVKVVDAHHNVRFNKSDVVTLTVEIPLGPDARANAETLLRIKSAILNTDGVLWCGTSAERTERDVESELAKF